MTAGRLLSGRQLVRSGNPEQLRKAPHLLETYMLDLASPTSVGRRLAFDNYQKLSQQLGFKAKSERELSNPKLYPRLLTSVEVAKGLAISISDPIEVVIEKLGPAQLIPVIAGANLVRLFYPQYGMELIATRDMTAIMPLIACLDFGNICFTQTSDLGIE